MSFFSTQNPGIGGLDELTTAEELLIQSLAALGDPGADRILFWDESANAYAFLTAGSGLTITNTTISATGGGTIDGSGTTNEIAYWVDADTLGALAVATYPSLAQLAHVKGVTSAIQTQLDSKLSSATAASTYQPLDSDLTTIAGLTATTDNFIVSVSSAWASRTPAQVRTTLGLVIGTNVQAYDADLTTWAGITPGTGVGTALAVNVGSAGAFVTFNGALGTPSSGTLTNATGLPIAGLVASTSTTIGVGSIELGHATDTTLARVTAGIISIEGEVMNGYATTATAAGTTALTITSATTQFFTGSTTQTVTLPTTSVIVGQSYRIVNNSTGIVTVQSSGANTIQILGAGMSAIFTAIVATPTTAANWSCALTSFTGQNIAQTASGNAATVNIAYVTNTITNNSAATITITLPTAGAIDGEMRVVRVLDFSAVAQTLTLVNTENSTVTPAATTNGSTTLPYTFGVQYNAGTSKWRVIASA